MELKDFLAWFVSGGGAGIVAYYLVGHVSFLAALQAEYKRWAAFAVSFVLAGGAFTLMATAGYQALPVSALDWIEKLFAVGTASFGLATLLHAHELREPEYEAI
ncbi:MAG: hypothetical protein WC455_23370 [Dehalococcoidia bacterium]|jgi:hypothetical protein